MVSTESSKTITAISVCWGSSVGGNWSWGSGNGNWGSYLVYVWYSCWFNVYVWFGSDFGMNIGFSSDFFMYIGFSSDFFMYIGFSGDFFMDIGFGSWVYLSGIIVWVDVCSWVSGICYW